MSTFIGLAKYYIWCLKSCYVSFHANKARKGREGFLPLILTRRSEDRDRKIVLSLSYKQFGLWGEALNWNGEMNQWAKALTA